MSFARYGTRLWHIAVTVLLLAGARPGRALDPHHLLGQYGRQRWGTENGLPQNTVRAIAQTPDGFLWLGTEDGLVRFDGVDFRVYTPENTPELASGMVEGLAIEGSRLRVRMVGGQTLLEEGRFRRDAGARGTGEERERGTGEVTATLTGRDGRVWVGTPTGLVQGGSQKQVVAGTGAVRVLFEDREGAVWAGCDEGLARVVGGRTELLRGSAVLAVFEDREGNLWAGTEADGVMELHEQRFTSYGKEEGLRGSVVRAVWEDARGTVWVGTDGGGLSLMTADGRFEEVRGLSSDVVLALAGGVNGDLWVGTPTGLNRVSGKAVKVFTAADGLADDYVRSLLVDRRGDVWVGTRHGLTRMSAGGMTTFTALDGLGSDFIGVMVQARDGGLWIGTSGGLTRFDGDRFTNIAVPRAVTAIHEDARGVLWLGTSGGGLMRLANGATAAVAVKGGELPRAISGVLEDGRRRLWVAARSGIFRVGIAAVERATEPGAGELAVTTYYTSRGPWEYVTEGGGELAVTAYDASDGMRVREVSSGGHPAAMRAHDGRLWFATLRGVTVVDPAHLEENKVPPLVAIERVLVNDRPVDPTLPKGGKDGAPGLGELVIAPGPQRVEFQYAGLSFVAPQKVEYRYWLDGFDRYWVEGGTRRAAFYTNLRPGRYVFHVAAANNDGVWSDADATIVVRVRPFFWQTWWFYLLMMLGSMCLAYWVYALRMRRVEARVGARYAGMMEERGRIAREIHDGLAQGIVSISLQLEVVTRLLGTSVEAAQSQLEEAKALVRQSLAEARSSIWALRAEDAEELPVRLGKALQQLTDAARVQGRLTVTGSYRAIAREAEDELLRIAQEAVTNAVRHAACTKVEITLRYDMKRVRLEVRDDGRGFDANARGPVGHFGLLGMRERAAKIGGTLELKSGPGQGTKVLVELELA